jgi:DNA-binding response OmpR family regulator
VFVARSGAEAMRLVNVEPPDIMLVDLMMPGMSGTELMVRLREMGMHVPIIIISADVDAPKRVRGHAMQGVLIKPFNYAELRAMIDRYVSGQIPKPTPARDEQQSSFHSPDVVDRKGLG